MPQCCSKFTVVSLTFTRRAAGLLCTQSGSIYRRYSRIKVRPWKMMTVALERQKGQQRATSCLHYYPVIWYLVLIVMLEVQRIDVEGFHNVTAVLQPEKVKRATLHYSTSLLRPLHGCGAEMPLDTQSRYFSIASDWTLNTHRLYSIVKQLIDNIMTRTAARTTCGRGHARTPSPRHAIDRKRLHSTKHFTSARTAGHPPFVDVGNSFDSSFIPMSRVVFSDAFQWMQWITLYFCLYWTLIPYFERWRYHFARLPIFSMDDLRITYKPLGLASRWLIMAGLRNIYQSFYLSRGLILSSLWLVREAFNRYSVFQRDGYLFLVCKKYTKPFCFAFCWLRFSPSCTVIPTDLGNG